MINANLGWFVLCDNALFDTENNVSLIACIEQVTSNAFPAFYPRLFLVGYFYREAASANADYEHLLRIVIDGPGENSSEALRGSSRFRAGVLRARTRVVLHGFEATVPGTYHFNLEVRDIEATEQDWTRVARLPLVFIHDPSTDVDFTKGLSRQVVSEPKAPRRPRHPAKRKSKAKAP